LENWLNGIIENYIYTFMYYIYNCKKKMVLLYKQVRRNHVWTFFFINGLPVGFACGLHQNTWLWFACTFARKKRRVWIAS